MNEPLAVESKTGIIPKQGREAAIEEVCDMDFHQLEMFTAVVETGSFSRAGERMFFSQPTVTMQVKALEDELAQQLLERSSQGVRVTAAGQRVYDYASSVLRERESLLAEFGRSDPETSHVSVAVSTVPAHYLLPQLISAFRKRHPGVQFHVLFCNSSEVGRALLDQRAQVGLCGSIAFLDGCEYRPVAKDRLLVITPNDERYSALESGAPFPDSLLFSEPMVVRESGSGTRREFEDWLRKRTGRAELNIAAVMSDYQAIKNAVVAGTGIAVMSERAAADYIRSGYVLGFPLEGMPPRDLCLVRRKKAKLLGLVREFYDFMLNTAPSLLRHPES